MNRYYVTVGFSVYADTDEAARALAPQLIEIGAIHRPR